MASFFRDKLLGLRKEIINAPFREEGYSEVDRSAPLIENHSLVWDVIKHDQTPVSPIAVSFK